jgi:hypothetical protein
MILINFTVIRKSRCIDHFYGLVSAKGQFILCEGESVHMFDHMLVKLWLNLSPVHYWCCDDNRISICCNYKDRILRSLGADDLSASTKIRQHCLIWWMTQQTVGHYIIDATWRWRGGGEKPTSTVIDIYLHIRWHRRVTVLSREHSTTSSYDYLLGIPQVFFLTGQFLCCMGPYAGSNIGTKRGTNATNVFLKALS